MGTTHETKPMVGKIKTVTSIEIPVDANRTWATWNAGGFRVRGSATLITSTEGEGIADGPTLVAWIGEKLYAGDADLVALVNAIVDHLSAKADFEAGREVTDWPHNVRRAVAAEILEGKIPGAGKTAAEQ